MYFVSPTGAYLHDPNWHRSYSHSTDSCRTNKFEEGKQMVPPSERMADPLEYYTMCKSAIMYPKSITKTYPVNQVSDFTVNIQITPSNLIPGTNLEDKTISLLDLYTDCQCCNSWKSSTWWWLFVQQCEGSLLMGMSDDIRIGKILSQLGSKTDEPSLSWTIPGIKCIEILVCWNSLSVILLKKVSSLELNAPCYQHLHHLDPIGWPMQPSYLPHFWMFLASDQPRNRGGRGRQTDCKIFLKDLLSLNHYIKTFFITPGKTSQTLEYSNSIVGFLKLETMSLWVWSCIEGYST